MHRRTRPANSADALQQYQNEVKNLKPNADQLGWLGHAGTYFIGMFQKGGEVFVGFVTGIIPTLVVLMTAFYALTGLIGEERVHGFAQSMGEGRAHPLHRAARALGVLPHQSDGLHVRHLSRGEAQACLL